ncbi:DNA glycosylase [Coniochaeta hoffmannii]|uniref:Adenine DNA glycosylase n=1 Tax=Coniochaeta hoffmannii TaxID=91930 RepID=A0AA38RY67_9PEZI|nr:DNA glycosylase [Coniochaeta hoffmannii]
MTRGETRKRKQPARPSRVCASRGREASPSLKTATVSDASSDDTNSESVEPLPKRRRAPAKHNRQVANIKPWKVILSVESRAAHPTSTPPARSHSVAYHRPLLLDSHAGQEGLLDWFDAVSSSRLMPWRRPWIDPRAWDGDPDGLRTALEIRAYQVWISEIMLQQTRVAVVIDYWKRWMDKWPTIRDLARADPEDVLNAWRGLGYYSRATRIHQAAKLIVEDSSLQGLLPADAHELKFKVPGIGPYTAGAISAIVFGHPEAMVDGNVIRVLSRQMGVLADFKASRAATELIWDAADALAKAVASRKPSEGGAIHQTRSDRPGRWGQALMELGSTVCAPKPDCSKCPISSTCRAYAEGMVTVAVSHAKEKARQSRSGISTPDIEDMCTLCQPMGDMVVGGAAGVPSLKKTPARPRKVASTVRGSSSGPMVSADPGEIDQHTLDIVVEYARRFPAKGLKKTVRVQESLVCAIRYRDAFLIQKRPSKGLLAGLWELPSYDIPEARKSTATSRKRMAQSYVSDIVHHLLPCTSQTQIPPLRHVGELGSVPWLFSHINLTMHVHLFHLAHQGETLPLPELEGRWATDDEIETGSTMGTGMRKCWTMVKMNSHF